MSGAYYEAPILVSISIEIVYEVSVRLGKASAHYGMIRLLNFPFLKHCIQSRQSLAGLGEDHSTGSGAIDTMCNAHKSSSGFVVAIRQITPHDVAQRSVARIVALYQHTTRLIDNYQVIVFIQHIDVGIA